MESRTDSVRTELPADQRVAPDRSPSPDKRKSVSAGDKPLLPAYACEQPPASVTLVSESGRATSVAATAAYTMPESSNRDDNELSAAEALSGLSQKYVECWSDSENYCDTVEGNDDRYYTAFGSQSARNSLRLTESSAACDVICFCCSWEAL